VGLPTSVPTGTKCRAARLAWVEIKPRSMLRMNHVFGCRQSKHVSRAIQICLLKQTLIERQIHPRAAERPRCHPCRLWRREPSTVHQRRHQASTYWKCGDAAEGGKWWCEAGMAAACCQRSCWAANWRRCAICCARPWRSTHAASSSAPVSATNSRSCAPCALQKPVAHVSTAAMRPSRRSASSCQAAKTKQAVH
jgi:hypothetical protein